MPTCNICGNDVPAGNPVCPFCENRLAGVSKKTVRGKIARLNIKQNMPTCAEAEKKLRNSLIKYAREGVACVKVIHGYGSSGVGGELRYCLRDALKSFMNTGIISFYVAGEDFSSETKDGAKLIRLLPALRKDRDYNKSNKGITLVKL